MTLWKFSCCWCATDWGFQGLMSSYGVIELWFVRVVKTVVGILSQCFMVSVEVKHWWFSSVLSEHLKVVLWWTDLPGGWLNTCADFQRSWFWWMYWSKMGSGQISVEVTVVVSILDAGVWVLRLRKLYLSYVMMRFCNLWLLSIRAMSWSLGILHISLTGVTIPVIWWCLIVLSGW